MNKVYVLTIKVDINKTGITYNITPLNNPTIYNICKYIGKFSPGYIYKIEDIKIINENLDIDNACKIAIGKKYYEPSLKLLNKNTKSNNYTLNYYYKKSNRVIIKGYIITSLQISRKITIDIYEIDTSKNEILLGSTLSDSNGNYYVNFPIKINRCYKLVASYIDL